MEVVHVIYLLIFFIEISNEVLNIDYFIFGLVLFELSLGLLDIVSISVFSLH